MDTSTIADLDSSNLADNSVEATLPEETPKEKPFFSVGIYANYLIPGVSNVTDNSDTIMKAQTRSSVPSFGISVTSHFSNFEISLGLNSIKIEDELSASFLTDSSFTTELTVVTDSFKYVFPTTGDTVMEYVYGTISETKDTSTQQDYDVQSSFIYLEIPVSVHLKMVEKNKWSFGINLGLTASVLLKSEGSVLISRQIGVNVGYKISNSWTVLARASYKNGLQPLFLDNNYPLETVDYVSFGVEIEYNFK